MALEARRQLLVWAAIPLLVGQVGCAARGVHAPPEGAAGIREAEEARCRDFARRIEADRYGDVKERSVVGPAILTAVAIPLALASLATIPLGGTPALGMVEHAGRWAQENAQHNRGIREGRKAVSTWAMTDCLQPTTLEVTLGPDHPDLGRSLRTLANQHVSLREYADAEALFKRAVSIKEKALGPDDPRLAATLQDYAVMLRKANREPEAAELDERLAAIEARREQPRHSEPPVPEEESPW